MATAFAISTLGLSKSRSPESHLAGATSSTQGLSRRRVRLFSHRSFFVGNALLKVFEPRRRQETPDRLFLSPVAIQNSDIDYNVTFDPVAACATEEEAAQLLREIEEDMNWVPPPINPDDVPNHPLPLPDVPPLGSYVCTSIMARTAEEFVEKMNRAVEQGADLLELRLDYLDTTDLDLSWIIHNRLVPVIVTCRPQREGGAWEESEEFRLSVLALASALGAEYIDIEIDSAHLLTKQEWTKTIISYHNYEETPSFEALMDYHKRMVSSGADIVKLATKANRVLDNCTIFRLLNSVQTPTIALAMGEHGQLSRVLAPKFKSFLTFTALETGSESAPGQMTVPTLLNTFRFRTINKDTNVYGILADPVAQSMSPAIHNAAFKERELNSVFVPLRVEPKDLAETVKSFRRRNGGSGELNIKGYSVTIPHKESVSALTDHMHPVAQSIGAANTIVERDDGELYAYNTDWEAAISAVEDAMGGFKGDTSPLKGKKVLVVGAGGAGRALAYGVVTRGGVPVIANRTLDRAAKLAEEIGGGALAVTLVDALKQTDADVIMNATSVGMYPGAIDESPLPGYPFKKGQVVFDSVYNPLLTVLLKDSAAAGATVVNGLEMFVRQAVKQFELWTGLEAPKDIMKATVEQKLAEKAEATRKGGADGGQSSSGGAAAE